MGACYFLGNLVHLFLHLVDGEEVLVSKVLDFEMNVFTFGNDV